MMSYEERRLHYESIKSCPGSILAALDSEISIYLSKRSLSDLITYNKAWVRTHQQDIFSHVKDKWMCPDSEVPCPLIKVTALLSRLRMLKEHDLCRLITSYAHTIFHLNDDFLLTNYVMASGFVEAVETGTSTDLFPLNNDVSLKTYIETSFRSPTGNKWLMTTLAKRHPELCMTLLRPVLNRVNKGTSLNEPPIEMINGVLDILIKSFARKPGGQNMILELFELIKVYLSDAAERHAQYDFGVLITHAPVAVWTWLNKPRVTRLEKKAKSHHWSQNKRQLGIKNFQMSSRAIRHLSKGHLKEVVLKNVELQTYLDFKSRFEIWEETREQYRDKDTGCLDYGYLSHFPISLREPEVLKCLEDDRDMDDSSVISYARLLPVDKAKPYIYAKARDSDFETREMVYEAFGSMVEEQKVDPDPFLEMCKRSINERDPVRGYLYMGLSNLSIHHCLTEENLDKLVALLDVTSEQIDISDDTATYIQSVLRQLCSRRTADVCRLNLKFKTMAEFSDQIYLPEDDLSIMSKEAWDYLDKYIMGHKRKSVSEWYIARVFRGPYFVKKLPLCLAHVMNYEDLWNVVSLRSVLSPVLEYLHDTDFDKYKGMVERLVKDHGDELLVNDHFAKYMAQYHPSIVEEWLAVKAYNKDDSRKVNLTHWQSMDQSKLSLTTKQWLVKLAYDRILSHFNLHEHSRVQNVLMSVNEDLKIIQRYRDVHPKIYLDLWDVYLEIVKPWIEMSTHAQPNGTVSHVQRELVQLRYIPVILGLALSRCDAPPLAIALIKARLQNDPTHQCAAIWQRLITRMSLKQQEALSKESLTLLVGCSSRIHDASFEREMNSCLSKPVASLSSPERLILTRLALRTHAFWDLVMREPQDRLFVRRVLAIPVLRVMSQGQLEPFKALFRQQLRARPVEIRRIGRYMKLGMLIDRDVLKEELLNIYDALMLDDPPYHDDGEAFYPEDFFPNLIQDLQTRIIKTLLQLTTSPKDLFGVLKHAKTTNAIRTLCDLITTSLPGAQMRDILFAEWFSKVKEVLPDSLTSQLCILSRIESATNVYEILKASEWLSKGGYFVWDNAMRCNTIELADRLSESAHYIDRYVAYTKYVATSNEAAMTKTLDSLQTEV
eukprot:Blabericola_migrator_1__1567@NODE_1414_length_4598_cov_153_380711_g941_i0_p1_GENE_NODE_1414_length_4598_cov_153_380711_g941_i0NODE_1414_length_4598_cov_153_380711_g941_i0_p1_ORF_typecomplete_len1116_score204_26_NODE_1414_length_4598_cov_153_380711_g941_i01013448